MLKRLALILLSTSTLMVTESAQASASRAAPSESMVWDLSDLYASPEAWAAEHQRLQAEVAQLARHKGALGRSAAHMATVLQEISVVRRQLSRLHVYASLMVDQDTRHQSNLARKTAADQLYTQFGEAVSWLAPEVLALGEKKVEAFIAKDKALAVHAFGLRDMLRAAPHTLDARSEAIVSATGDLRGGGERIYNQLANADIPWPVVRFSTGEEARLNQAGYGKWRQAASRADRKLAFDSFWGRWADYESSLGEAFKTHMQGQVFEARLRNYDSVLHAALDRDSLPQGVYDTLIRETRAGLPVLHRYFKLRGRMMGIADMAYYDLYPDLVQTSARYDVATSKALTRTALQPFGPTYIAALDQGFAGRWMHVAPADGKRSGAYMNGSAYDVHPYVLLNHQDDYDSLSTFAHEWGHAVHSVLANAAQPYETADYATMVAETASTINEILLLEHMLKQAKTDDERLYFLGAGLDMLRGTYFRQAMLSEFEHKAYQAVEAGTPVTGEALTALYTDTLRAYHGADAGVVAIDPAYGVEWAYIPHFYYNYYVYQYSTSIAGAVVLAERLLAGDADVQARFVAALQKGGSDYPYEILQAAGADLATPAPYQAVMARMTRIMDEMDAILTRQGR